MNLFAQESTAWFMHVHQFEFHISVEGSRVRLIYTTTSDSAQTLFLIKVCLIVDRNRCVTYVARISKGETDFLSWDCCGFPSLLHPNVGTVSLKDVTAAVLHPEIS